MLDGVTRKVLERIAALSTKINVSEASMQRLTTGHGSIEDLGILAKITHPKSWYPWGHLGSTGSVRKYVCYVCSRIVDTDSAKNRPTVHANTAIGVHIAAHKAGENLETPHMHIGEMRDAINDALLEMGVQPGSQLFAAVLTALEIGAYDFAANLIRQGQTT